MKYLETIKIVNGEIKNLNYHLERIKRTIGKILPINFNIPQELCHGIIKCRIVYDNLSIIKIEYLPYTMPIIKTLRLIEQPNINYKYKYEDRSKINELKLNCAPFEDILITQNGFITDTSFCNIVLKNKQGFLFTPSTPLLNGTKRQQLLNDGLLQSTTITIGDLPNYTHIYLINAMIDITSLGSLTEVFAEHFG
ncbi:MAG: aminotransferase class IV [Bacteroidales bacterium]